MAIAPKLVFSHITKDPRVCGGAACIDATRIRVIDVVQAQSEGYSPDEIQKLFAVPLTLAQVYSALAYADENPHESERNGKRPFVGLACGCSGIQITAPEGRLWSGALSNLDFVGLRSKRSGGANSWRCWTSRTSSPVSGRMPSVGCRMV